MEKIQVYVTPDGYYDCKIDITKDEWLEILKGADMEDKTYIDALSKFLREPGHRAACGALGKKYQVDGQYFNSSIMNFGKHVKAKLNRFEVVGTDQKETYWNIPMFGKRLKASFEWTMRRELVDALREYLIEDLIRRYKEMLKGPSKSFNNELYKWQLLTDCEGKSTAEILDKLCHSNIIDLQYSGMAIKKLLESNPDETEAAFDALLNEGSFADNFKEYRKIFDSIASDKFQFKVGDERTAAAFMTCVNPDKYTFYNNSIYQQYCKFLGEETKVVGEKYIHYLKLMIILSSYAQKDTELIEMLKAKTSGLVWSDLLVAQDILWEMQSDLIAEGETVVADDVPEEPLPVSENPNYWWLNANPSIWHFTELAVGGSQTYTMFNEKGNKRKIFQNFMDSKPGDLIIGYESNPTKQAVALAVVTNQDGKELTFTKTANLPSPVDYATLKDCKELENMQYFSNPNGSIFKLKKQEYDFILELSKKQLGQQEEKADYNVYTKSDFLKDVFIDSKSYDRLVNLLKHKKNIILQGAPGVGKTYAAKRLAYSIIGEENPERIQMVQFHQSYSYEDFIMGYRPTKTGFELKTGVFYDFCKKAAKDSENPYFFIIDEINRGNLSKIFGELFMLIEADKRGEDIKLVYSDEVFTVPRNVHIIGMLNTADRSLAMLDYALRRRFSFFEMVPAIGTKAFDSMLKIAGNHKYDSLIKIVCKLNDAICEDPSLGKGFRIGHSYFCTSGKVSDEKLVEIVEYELIPLLEEYWFDEPDKVDSWSEQLRTAIK